MKMTFKMLLIVLWVTTTHYQVTSRLVPASNLPELAAVGHIRSEWMNICEIESITEEQCKCPILDGAKDILLSCNIIVKNVNASIHTSIVANKSLNDDLLALCRHLTIPVDSCTCNSLKKYHKQCTPTHLNITTKVDNVIQKSCNVHNISLENCNCPNLYYYTGQSKQCWEDQETRDADIFVNGPTDLLTMCASFRIPKNECMCPELGIRYPNLKKLCAYPMYENLLIQCLLDHRIKAQVIFTLFACSFGVLGNFLVLVVRSHQWKNSIHYKLISGLAFADLTFSILQIIYNVPKLIIGCKWAYGLGMCKVLHSFLGVSYSIDLGFIVIIAIERYVAIVFPLADILTETRVYFLVLANIIFSFIGVIPAAMVLTIDEGGRCVEDWKGFPFNSLDYSWMLMIVYFIIPVFITSVLYRSSMCALKRALERRMSAVHEASRSKLAFENRRILIVLSALLVALVVLVCPNRIVWIILDSIGSENISNNTLTKLKIFAIVPYSLHIMINPIIYSMVDKRFRNNAVFLLVYLKRRRSTLITTNYSLTASSALNANTTQMTDRSTVHGGLHSSSLLGSFTNDKN